MEEEGVFVKVLLGEEGRDYFYHHHPDGLEEVVEDEAELKAFLHSPIDRPLLLHLFYIQNFIRIKFLDKFIYLLPHFPPTTRGTKLYDEVRASKRSIPRGQMLLFEVEEEEYMSEAYLINILDEFDLEWLKWKYIDGGKEDLVEYLRK